MASTLKKFLPPGWDDVADGEVIIKSASGVVGGSMSATVGAESITNAEISPTAAIDVSKLANGSVSNEEFQYLDGVSSAIQTQLTGKQASILGTGASNDSVEFASKVLLHGTEGVVGSNYIIGDELFQLNGVTSNIQIQLNGKQSTLGTGSITTTLLGDLQVTEAKIDNGAVTTAKFGTPSFGADDTTGTSVAASGNAVVPAGAWYVWASQMEQLVLEVYINGSWRQHGEPELTADAWFVVSDGTNFRVRNESISTAQSYYRRQVLLAG